MNKQTFELYRDLKLKQKQLEEEIKIISGQIIEDMRINDLEKVKLEDGSGVFSLVGRKTWEYSPAVMKKEEELKELKTEEQSRGIAKANEIKILVFKEPKQNEE